MSLSALPNAAAVSPEPAPDSASSVEEMTAVLMARLSESERRRARLRRAQALYLPACRMWVLARKIEELDVVNAGLSDTALAWIVSSWQQATERGQEAVEPSGRGATMDLESVRILPEVTNAFARLALVWPRVVATPEEVLSDDVVYLDDVPPSDRQVLMQYGREDEEVRQAAETFLPPPGGADAGLESVPAHADGRRLGGGPIGDTAGVPRTGG